MGADFTAELANGIGSVDTKLTGLANSAHTAKKAGSDLGDQFERAFKLAGRHVREASEEMEGMGHQIYEVGHALKAAGGPLGEFAHKLTGGFRFDGPLIALATAAGAAGLGIEIYNKIAERHVEQVKRQIEEVEKLGDELYQIDRKSKEGALSSAESNASAERKLSARGGVEGQEQVDKIAASGQGIERHDARDAVTKSYNLKQNIRQSAVAAARYVAASGEMSMSEAMDIIERSPEIQSRLHDQKNGDTPNLTPAAQRIILRGRNLAPTKANRDQAQRELDEPRKGQTGVFGATNAIIDNKNRLATRDHENLINGTAAAESDRATNRAMDPFSAKLDDVARANELAAAANTKLAESQTGLARFLATFGEKLGGAGSEAQKAARDNATRTRVFSEGLDQANDYRDGPSPEKPRAERPAGGGG